MNLTFFNNNPQYKEDPIKNVISLMKKIDFISDTL